MRLRGSRKLTFSIIYPHGICRNIFASYISYRYSLTLVGLTSHHGIFSLFFSYLPQWLNEVVELTVWRHHCYLAGPTFAIYRMYFYNDFSASCSGLNKVAGLTAAQRFGPSFAIYRRYFYNVFFFRKLQWLANKVAELTAAQRFGPSFYSLPIYALFSYCSHMTSIMTFTLTSFLHFCDLELRAPLVCGTE